MSKQFRMLVGSDGSPSANAALAAAAVFPWPRSIRATGVVALGASSWASGSRVLSAVVVRALHAEAGLLRRKLAEHWPDANVVELHEPAGAAILSEAKRIRADAIVLGWRVHGTFKRLLAGSVSRQVVAAASCPVLVVRAAPTRLRRFVIGFDGTPTSRRAVRARGPRARAAAGRVTMEVVVFSAKPYDTKGFAHTDLVACWRSPGPARYNRAFLPSPGERAWPSSAASSKPSATPP
jgi:nucleotide-binding universal stress UspA family protein